MRALRFENEYGTFHGATAKEKLLAQSRAAHLNSQMEAIIARTSPKDTSRDAPMTIPVVTIDGPAASGKSSVSRELARRLGWSWVSTGAFYRGLAYVANQLKIDLKDESALVKLATSDVWSVVMDVEKTRVVLKGKDVTDEVNREEVGSLASVVSSHPKVRQALLDAQRRCSIGVSGLVAEGRDCGTVVFPKANVKVFLTARSEDRAARRAKDEGASVSDTQAAQKIRDTQDANRKAAPMMASSDAHNIDTSELSFGEVVAKVEGLVRSQVPLKSI